MFKNSKMKRVSLFLEILMIKKRLTTKRIKTNIKTKNVKQ